MSRKIATFRAVNIAPQPSCNYVVWIPSIFTSPVSVESTTMPFGEVESRTIAVRGVTYSIPVKKKAQGQWSCTLSENLLLSTLYQSLWKQHSEVFSNNILNSLMTVEYNDIYIYITDGATATVPIAACVLKHCYLTKIDNIELKSSGATDPVRIRLTFQYNDIEDAMTFIENMIDTSIYQDEKIALQTTAAIGGLTLAAITANKVKRAVGNAIDNGIDNEINNLKDSFSRVTGNNRFINLND